MAPPGQGSRVSEVVQLSLFSADVDEPVSADLAGLLAAHGQSQHTDTGTRISIAVTEPWRAQAIVRELLSTGLPAEIGASGEGNPIARTTPAQNPRGEHSRTVRAGFASISGIVVHQTFPRPGKSPSGENFCPGNG